MVKVKFNPKTFKLDIKGHANSGPKGDDLVCAAATTLITALALTAAEFKDSGILKKESKVVLDDGKASVQMFPKAEFEGNVSLLYYPIVTGYEGLSKAYPQFLRLEIV